MDDLTKISQQLWGRVKETNPDAVIPNFPTDAYKNVGIFNQQLAYENKKLQSQYKSPQEPQQQAGLDLFRPATTITEGLSKLTSNPIAGGLDIARGIGELGATLFTVADKGYRTGEQLIDEGLRSVLGDNTVDAINYVASQELERQTGIPANIVQNVSLADVVAKPFELAALGNKLGEMKISEFLEKHGIGKEKQNNALRFVLRMGGVPQNMLPSDETLNEIAKSQSKFNDLFAQITVGAGIMPKGGAVRESFNLPKEKVTQKQIEKLRPYKIENVKPEILERIKVDKTKNPKVFRDIETGKFLSREKAQQKLDNNIREIQNAESIRSDERQIRQRGITGEESQTKGSENIQQQAPRTSSNTEEAQQIIESEGGRFEGLKDNTAFFTNKKTGGTFTLDVKDVTPETVRRIFENDKNKPIEELPPKATPEELKTAFEKAKPETKVEGNIVAIQRMLGENKKPEDIASALNINVKDVLREKQYQQDLREIANKPPTAGFDPSTNLAYIRAGLYHFRNGLKSFKDWGAKIVSVIGDKIKPYLLNLWAKVKKAFDTGEDIIPNLQPKFNVAVDKLRDALKQAKISRRETEKLYAQERSKRAGSLAQAFERGKEGGEKTYYEALKTQKGELPKAEYNPIRDKLNQETVNDLFNAVAQSDLRPFQKLSAETGLVKLVGKEFKGIPNRYEMGLLEQVFGSGLIKDILKKRTNWEKIKENFLDIINIPRAIMSSVDFSAILRQGLVLTVGHPVKAFGNVGRSIKSFFSDEFFREMEKEIETRTNVDLYNDAGLFLSGRGLAKELTQREEVFMSRLKDKIPLVGWLIKASERSYLSFLNRMRADVFDGLTKAFQKDGHSWENNPKLYEDMAQYVNNASGRGNLGQFGERVAPLLNSVFFSPRNFVAKLNLLNPFSKFYWRVEKPLRVEAWKNMFSLVGAGVTVLSLARLAGASVEDDPRSSDFGKIRIGNTRWDIWGGFQQPVRFIAQIVSGKYKSTTGTVRELSAKKFPFTTRWDLFLRFFEQKLSPQAGFVVDLARGESMIGKELTLKSEAQSNLIPLYLQDAVDAYNDMGWSSIPLTVPAIFGVGLQSYKIKTKKQNKTLFKSKGKQFKSLFK